MYWVIYHIKIFVGQHFSIIYIFLTGDRDLAEKDAYIDRFTIKMCTRFLISFIGLLHKSTACYYSVRKMNIVQICSLIYISNTHLSIRIQEIFIIHRYADKWASWARWSLNQLGVVWLFLSKNLGWKKCSCMKWKEPYFQIFSWRISRGGCRIR